MCETESNGSTDPDSNRNWMLRQIILLLLQFLLTTVAPAYLPQQLPFGVMKQSGADSSAVAESTPDGLCS